MKKVNCSFCNATQDEVLVVVQAMYASIFNECVALCNDLIGNHLQKKQRNPQKSKNRSKAKIKDALLRRVIEKNNA